MKKDFNGPVNAEFETIDTEPDSMESAIDLAIDDINNGTLFSIREDIRRGLKSIEVSLVVIIFLLMFIFAKLY